MHEQEYRISVFRTCGLPEHHARSDPPLPPFDADHIRPAFSPLHFAGRDRSGSIDDNSMEMLIAARVLHVMGVVLWIGGVALVTTVLLPATRRMASPAQRVAFFESIERRFAWQARATTL